jgi:phage virion morphogenesis protein
MANITISVDDKEVSQALHALKEKVIDLRPVLTTIGELLTESTQDRLDSGKNIDPTGKPWVTLQPWYQEQKKQYKNRILSLSGHLAKEIKPQVPDGHTVIVGTNVPYAAIHQFGGVIRPKTANALNVGGRAVKKVTIPARPFLGISNQDKENILDAVLNHMAAAWR